VSELKDLVGPHVLDAVDFENVSTPSYEGADYTSDSQVCRFRIDGVVWAVLEAPPDGYGSSMRELRRQRKNSKAKLSNIFTATPVLAVYVDHGYGSDLLTMYAIENGKPVLTVGTDRSDDYYPNFVASFAPENLPVNSQLASS